MHQQQRAIEQPLASKILSRSDQRPGVSGWMLSFISGHSVPVEVVLVQREKPVE
jgi:hypothetical protein